MSTTIEDRVILLLKEQEMLTPELIDSRSFLEKALSYSKLGGHGFWERLAKITGVPSKRWRKVFAREQRITSDMLSPLATAYPMYAFWLVTGITDSINGHIAPSTAQTFPERSIPQSEATNNYFRKCIDLLEKLYLEAKVNQDDDKERLFASERTRPLAHWWESPLSDTAYRIAGSEEYLKIEQIRQDREQERSERLLYVNKPEKRPWNRQKEKQRNLEQTPMLGIDPRSQHQDSWDLFYIAHPTTRTKFALSILNKLPSDLDLDEISFLCNLPLATIIDYLQAHAIDSSQVFLWEPGSIRFMDQPLTNEEKSRLQQLIKTKK